jgi:ORF6N domain
MQPVYEVVVAKSTRGKGMPAINPRPENVAPLVRLIRGEKVLLDSDLAALYGVEARALNQAVARNRGRFPADFMFRLSSDEYQAIRSQSVTASKGRKLNSSQTVMSSRKHRGQKYRPYVFTEQGIAMLSSVLRSHRAVEVNIAIMRTFVQLRRLMDGNRELARRINAMEKKYDEQFTVVFDAIRRLIAEDDVRKAQPKRRIGFTS